MFAPALLLLAACGSGGMAESWQLDRLRILAVQAEPAEPRPGETTSFRSLVYLPPDTELDAVVWFACLPEAADDFGCLTSGAALDEFASVDPSTLTPEEMQEMIEAAMEAGLIGLQPLWQPSWTPPPDALDALDDTARLEGLSAIVNVTAIPAGAEGDDDLEIAYKRVPVSLASTPNHNPAVTELWVDGEPVEPGAPFQARRGRTYDVDPVIADDSVETYTYVSSDGATEERTEEPYFTWYAEGGAFDQPFSLHPYGEVEWTAPDEAWEGLVVVVMRDRRGGMAWNHLAVAVE